MRETTFIPDEKGRRAEKAMQKKCTHCESEVKMFYCKRCNNQIDNECFECHSEATHKDLETHNIADKLMRRKPFEN